MAGMEFGFGTGILTGIRTDNTGTNTPIRFGAFQGVNVEFSGDIKELYAMGQYPLDTARGKVKLSGKAKVAQIRAKMYNELFFGQTLSTGQVKYAFNESTTLGTGAASYTVANSGSTPLTDQGVFLASDQATQLTPVSSSPGSGQYTFTAATGVYTFSTHSASLGMLFNYTYSVTTGYTISSVNPFMGDTPRFKATLFQKSPHSSDQIVLVLYACVAARLTFPTSIDDYVISDLDFSANEDTGTGKVFDWSTAQ